MKSQKNTPVLAATLFCIALAFGTKLHAQEEDLKPNAFELKLGGGFLSKLNFSSMGFGVVAHAQPRFFVSQNYAITGRAQWAGYLSIPFDEYDYEGEVNTYSFLAGMHSRKRDKRVSFLWGVETGAAFVREYTGIDSGGYSEYGPTKSYWVLQPSLGFAAKRFELEALYQYSPSSFARFFMITAGVRLGGGWR